MIKELNLKQGSEEWLESRKKHVTSSDAPVILQKSPYSTPLKIFEEKLGLADHSENKDYIFAKGHAIEALMRDKYIKELELEMFPAVFKNKFLLSSLDGYNPQRILEVKYMGKNALKQVGEGKIPEHHKIQVMHHLNVMEMDKCDYLATDGEETVLWEVGRDEKFIKEMFQKEKEFYELLKSKKPPELTEKDFYKIKTKKEKAIFQALIKAKKIFDVAEANYKALEKQVKSLAEEHPRVECEGVKVSTFFRRGNVDYKQIPELEGVDLEKYRKKESKMVRVSYPKEN